MFQLRLKKNFWRKIVVTNCLFLIFVVGIFTAIRYHTSVHNAKKAAKDVLLQYAGTTSDSFQLMFDDMSRLTLNIAVSDTTTEILKNAVRYDGKNNYFENAQSERRRLMNMMQQMAGPHLFQNSINIVSVQGDYILLDVYSFPVLSRNEIQSLSKLDSFQGENTYKFISKAAPDSFHRTDARMFSYARKISDEYQTLGYVEFQKPVADLDSIFQNASEAFQTVSVVTLNDELFYASDPEFYDYSEQLSSQNTAEESDGIRTLQLKKDAYFLCSTSIPAYGFKVYTLLPKSYYTNQIQQEIRLLIIQSIALLLSMLFLILLISKQIYKPVRTLRRKMENMELDDIKSGLQLSENADEIELFNHVFAQMLERIQHQKDELIQQKIRELKVSYKALQSQVSPHFLYNTLYLIGLKGEEHGVPEILDMCSCLTHMMGYSVDTKYDLVPIAKELEYMDNYLQLMKYRYLDKLQYELDIEASVASLLVPKFILQPLIENCFTHGFKNCAASQFFIHFSLRQNENTWTLQIEDNGNGFSKEDKERIYKDISLIRKSVENPNAHFVDKLTGIGLINTYARLFISYSSNISLKIGTGALSGGLVEITCPVTAGHTAQNISAFHKED